MPTHIYSNHNWAEQIGSLSHDSWGIYDQLDALKIWLAEHPDLPPGNYMADIGFMISPGATGGGAVLEPDMMRMLADLGMSLYFSEYSGESDHADETETS